MPGTKWMMMRLRVKVGNVLEKGPRGLKSLGENHSFAPSGLVSVPLPIPRLAPWAAF
jgi:hypothetical protein